MRKNIFVEEMKRRGKEDDNTYTMIGTELKRVRTSQSQTLSSVAGDLCSVSYLCKIEKAQLKPNRYMLNEICKKLNVDYPIMDLLFQLKKLLLKMVDCYYEKDWKEIENIYLSCKNLDNYRTKLIFLIYDLSFFKLAEANEVSIELFKITSVMHDDELSIFMVFFSILKFYEESYEEALDNFKNLSDLYNLNDVLGKIASIVCLECYIKINSPMTLLHSQRLLDLFLKTSEFSKAEYVRYLQILYMIQNSMLDCAYQEIQYIQSKEYKSSLEFFMDVETKHLKRKEDYTDLRPFAKLLHTYIFNQENYLLLFCEMDKNLGYACDFSYNIANYLTLSDDTERFSELIDIIIPNVRQTHNDLEKLFFLHEFCRISTKFGRYKSFCKAYDNLYGGKIKL